MMFRALVNSRLAALFGMWFRSNRKGKKRSPLFRILIGIFAIYVIACFLFMFGALFYSIRPLGDAGLGWFYFAMTGIVAFALCFIGSVFTVQQQLYDSHDNEMLLAMPIPPSYILGSRMIALYLMNLFFEMMVLIPAAVVWFSAYPFRIGQIIFILLIAAFLPLLSLAFSCVFGWLLTLLLSRVRNKTMISMIFSLLFLGIYFYAFSGMNRYLTLFLAHGQQIAAFIQAAVYPAWALGSAVAENNLPTFLGFLLCCVLPFAAVYWLLSKSFISMVTRKRGITKMQYHAKALKTSSPASALLQKELRHFFSNGQYIMNAAMGSIFTLVGAVFLLFRQDMLTQITSQFPIPPSYLAAAAAAMLCAISTTNLVSAPSVSLEGKNLWLAKSLPISAETILISKVNCHMVITLPPLLFASAVAAFVLKTGFFETLVLFAAPAAMTWFCGLLGVVVNLHFPKMDYLTDVAAVKQSASSIISMFASMGAVLLPGLLYIFFLNAYITPMLYLLLYAALLACICAVMHLYLKKGGAKRFEAL